ncbi:phosphatase PAP2/dual specificity phosphatase family protein [Aquipseudomonas campi]
MNAVSTARETGLWKRGVLWLLVLGPLFFASYGFANWLTAQRDDVGSLVFAWESQTPLWAWTIVPYWSIDLLYGLSFLLPVSRREMDRHALRLLSTQLLCVACFLLWPLRFTFERPALEGTFGLMFDVLMGFDKPFNQAPSLHIALLVVIWVMFARHTHGPWLRGLLHGWMALIGVSVLTTWQHHFIDVPTGVLAGWLCVWLWPIEGRSPLLAARPAKMAKRWRLALRYAFGAALCVAIAANVAGIALWLLWPAVALLLVALIYALVGAEGFQKQADGRLTQAVNWLFAPYLLGAWLNSRLWTRRQPAPSEIVPGIWLGRLPDAKQLQGFAAVVDLCAELPLNTQGKAYRSIPVLDLTAPTVDDCLQAAAAIEALRQQGPLLVCCALGYSRSACAVAAWLLLYGGGKDVDDVLQRIRQARPQIVLSDAHQQVLSALRQLPAQAPIAQEVAHGL